MQVSVTSEQGLERRLKVSLPAERLDEMVHQRLRRLGSQARVPGFRPGKAPQQVLIQRFGGQAREEAVNELIRISYGEALQQSGLKPAGGPSIELAALPATGQGLEYTAVFDVYPEIQLNKLAELTIKRPKVSVAEPDVERVIKSLREQHTKYETVARAAAAGDKVTMDFEGRLDGEVFEGGTARDFEVVIGAGRLLPDMENSLAGHAAGESYVVAVKFPDDYAAEKLRGKSAEFSITVKSVSQGRLPELDDEFLRSVNVGDGGVAALREKITASLNRQAENTVKARLKTQVFEQLLAKHPVAVPRGLLGEEIERMRSESLNRLPPRLRRDLEKDPQKLAQLLPEDNFREAANRRVALGLLVAEFVKQRSLKLDPQRVDQALAVIAADYDKPDEVIRHYRSNPRMLQGVEAMVLEEQVVDALLAGAKVEDVATSFESLVKPVHGEAGHVHGPDCDHD